MGRRFSREEWRELQECFVEIYRFTKRFGRRAEAALAHLDAAWQCFKTSAPEGTPASQLRYRYNRGTKADKRDRLRRKLEQAQKLARDVGEETTATELRQFLENLDGDAGA